jgi:Domain of unknown function (DUF4470)
MPPQSPIGCVPATSLTRDLPPSKKLSALVLANGDPRNVLYTLYSERDSSELLCGLY